eukprot:1778628-Rhodomonas_salina.1
MCGTDLGYGAARHVQRRCHSQSSSTRLRAYEPTSCAPDIACDAGEGGRGQGEGEAEGGNVRLAC